MWQWLYSVCCKKHADITQDLSRIIPWSDYHSAPVRDACWWWKVMTLCLPWEHYCTCVYNASMHHQSFTFVCVVWYLLNYSCIIFGVLFQETTQKLFVIEDFQCHKCLAWWLFLFVALLQYVIMNICNATLLTSSLVNFNGYKVTSYWMLMTWKNWVHMFPWGWERFQL